MSEKKGNLANSKSFKPLDDKQNGPTMYQKNTKGAKKLTCCNDGLWKHIRFSKQFEKCFRAYIYNS